MILLRYRLFEGTSELVFIQGEKRSGGESKIEEKLEFESIS